MKKFPKYRIGVYAGSFDPFHVGHKDVLDQAMEFFDEVHLAAGNNPTKDLNNREPLPKFLNTYGCKVDHYSGLLSDYMNKLGYDNDTSRVYLVRGLRDGDDLSYEDKQLRYLKSMYPGLQTMFFRCNFIHDHISSSSLRALRKFSEEEYAKYTFK
jgi:pantetheine-phosphate adenylyltransferase